MEYAGIKLYETVPPRAPKTSHRARLGWIVVLLACVVLLVTLWMTGTLEPSLLAMGDLFSAIAWTDASAIFPR